MKDTFLTIQYKNEFIGTCHNRETGKDEIKWRGKEFKSIFAAKLAITRLLKVNDKNIETIMLRIAAHDKKERELKESN
jgi:hypothetical protein